MTRWKATSIHFIASVFFMALVAIFIRTKLYPSFYIDLADGFRLLFLVAAVNIVIGPLLTAIVYKEGKKTLKFDLSVVVMLQLAALAYGIYMAWITRPVYSVYVVDRFSVVAPIDIKQENLEKAELEYKQFSWFGPKFVAAELPIDPNQKMALTLSGLSGADVETYPQYYVPLEKQLPEIIKRAKPLFELRGKTTEASNLIDHFLTQYKGKEEDYRYLPIKGFSPDFMSMVVRVDGTPVTALAIDPW